jgi:hypothetical protein
MKCNYSLLAAAFVLLHSASAQEEQRASSLPVVDLGYELHQAIAFKVSYIFCSTSLNQF